MPDVAASFSLHPPAGLLGAPYTAIADVAPGDVVICGYFCDNLAGGPPGARFLARQLRYASEHDLPPAHVHDLGDLNVFPLEPKKHAAAISEQLSMIAAVGAVPIFVGGDKSGAEILVSHAIRLKSVGDERAPIAAIDMATLAPKGTSVQTLIDAIDRLPEGLRSGAVYGLAPELDWRGVAETRLAHTLLSALARKLMRRHADAVA